VSPVTAYVGLGSNLGDPVAQVRRALQALSALPHGRLLASAGFYRSAALRISADAPGQPDYINSAAALETGLSPLELLRALQRIEASQGRVRTGPWGARTLDLDLLLYGELEMQTPELTLPHPQIGRRAFVLLPLGELAGEGVRIPGQGILRELLGCCPPPPAVRLAD
jgi:2-amino-4-hydroxy-6-hydroxymethyldihydropteridine diphosphokinase